MKNFKSVLSIVIAVSSLLPLSANAQTFESGGNRFETPIGMRSNQDIDLPAQSTRDENGNRVIIRSNNRNSTSIGNLINVSIRDGKNNTVVINAHQTNYGKIVSDSREVLN